MIRQQKALMATEGVELSFTDAAIRRISQATSLSLGEQERPCPGQLLPWCMLLNPETDKGFVECS